MPTTSPARIDDDLYASARLAGEVQSRSASQQVVHWARIGREIEASASIAQKDIAEALAGSRSYDTLSTKEQAVVRAEWSARMDTRREALNFAEELTASGRSGVEVDDNGAVVDTGLVERTQAAGRGRAGLGRGVVKSANASATGRAKDPGRAAGAHATD